MLAKVARGLGAKSRVWFYSLPSGNQFESSVGLVRTSTLNLSSVGGSLLECSLSQPFLPFRPHSQRPSPRCLL